MLENSVSIKANSGQSVSLRTRIKVEWSTWASLALVAALMEGGVIGVLIKNGFQNHVEVWGLNIAVAIATGAPFFSNLLSFYWVGLSRGRSKAVLVSNLAVVFCLCTLLMSFVSFTQLGLAFFLFILILARIVWSGILTVRSNIWRANYPRHIRGKVTAKLATLSALLMSLASVSVGWVLDWQFEYFRWLFVAFSCLSIIGAYRYRCLAVRNQHKEISREKNNTEHRSIMTVFSLLKKNKPFGKYMLAMFILGSGNLMFMAPLIVFTNEHSDLSQLQQILMTTAIPLFLIPFAVGRWASLLDGHHIFYFRSIHSWGFVIALSFFLSAQIFGLNSLFFIASIFYGVALSGGVIGWNLGHNDFVGKSGEESKSENPMDYMAIHVTLTGLRGLFMPLIGISFYQWLESIAFGYGKYALILPLIFTSVGAMLFVLFNRQFKASN